MNKMIGFRAIATLGPVTAWWMHMMIDPPSMWYGVAWLVSWFSFFMAISFSYDEAPERDAKVRISNNEIRKAEIDRDRVADELKIAKLAKKKTTKPKP